MLDGALIVVMLVREVICIFIEQFENMVLNLFQCVFLKRLNMFK